MAAGKQVSLVCASAMAQAELKRKVGHVVARERSRVQNGNNYQTNIHHHYADPPLGLWSSATYKLPAYLPEAPEITHFFAREDEAKQTEDAPAGTNRCRSVVLHGLGGRKRRS